MEDKPRTGRPSSLDEDQLNALLHEDPRTTTRELATAMGCVYGTIENHLNSMGKVQKLGAWVPHELTQAKIPVCPFAPHCLHGTDWLGKKGGFSFR